MGIQALLGGQQRVQLVPSSLPVISIDCTVQETHSRESPPSEFPLEDGVSISDNIWVKPFTLEINGIISDTPLSPIGGLITSAVASTLGNAGVIALGAGQALFKAISGAKSPSVQAYAQLLQLQEQRKPFDVITKLRRYTNMFIKSISVPRDSGTGNVLNFTLQLVELVIVSPQSVDITVFKNADVSAGEADEGQQQANEFVNGIKAGIDKVDTVYGRISK